jgi:hypothetical protein
MEGSAKETHLNDPNDLMNEQRLSRWICCRRIKRRLSLLNPVVFIQSNTQNYKTPLGFYQLQTCGAEESVR